LLLRVVLERYGGGAAGDGLGLVGGRVGEYRARCPR
jgi:hypothetical protein